MALHAQLGPWRNRTRPGPDLRGGRVLGARGRQEDRSIAAWRHGALLLAVSDGMSGHPRGDEASALCIEALAAAFEQARPPAKLSEWPRVLRSAVLCADDAVNALGASLQAGSRRPGATLAALLIVPRLDIWVFASVGDSHLYHLRPGGALIRVNTLHRNGRGVLTAYIGGGLRDVDGARTAMLLRPGDTFLLATQGIDRLSESEIQASLAHGDGAADVASILQAQVAGKRGPGPAPEPDGLTILVARAPVLHSAAGRPAGFLDVSR